MKTIVIWDDCNADIKFFVLEGNYSHLESVYINALSASSPEDKQEELTDLIFTTLGEFKLPVLKQFPTEQLPAKELFCVIVAGCIP